MKILTLALLSLTFIAEISFAIDIKENVTVIDNNKSVVSLHNNNNLSKDESVPSKEKKDDNGNNDAVDKTVNFFKGIGKDAKDIYHNIF